MSSSIIVTSERQATADGRARQRQQLSTKDRTNPNQLSTIEQLYSTIDNSNDSDRHGSNPMKYGRSYSTSYDNYTAEKQRTKLDELLSEESAAKDIQQEG